MSEKWLEIRLSVPAAGIDLIAAALAELGCEGVTVEERKLDTFIPPDPDEAPVGDFRIRAYFRAPDDSAGLQRRVRDQLAWLQPLVPGLIPSLPEVAPVQQEDWAEGWKQHFSTVHIGSRLVVRPSWEDYQPAPGEAVVVLDPGMAFGTGTHGTTRLCLEALARLFDGDVPPRRVLDVGTGSGILAIAAAALGAAEVLACDIEPEACRVAAENSALNGVSDKVVVTSRPLDDLDGSYQAVLANILAEENIRLAEALVNRLSPGGSLILSGILQEKEALVAEAFTPFGLLGPEVTRQDEWSCLVYSRPV